MGGQPKHDDKMMPGFTSMMSLREPVLWLHSAHNFMSSEDARQTLHANMLK